MFEIEKTRNLMPSKLNETTVYHLIWQIATVELTLLMSTTNIVMYNHCKQAQLMLTYTVDCFRRLDLHIIFLRLFGNWPIKVKYTNSKINY